MKEVVMVGCFFCQIHEKSYLYDPYSELLDQMNRRLLDQMEDRDTKDVYEYPTFSLKLPQQELVRTPDCNIRMMVDMGTAY
jgi:hypothetical protein